MSSHHDSHHQGCSCCSEGLNAAYEAARKAGLSRRNFLLSAGSAAISSWAIGGRLAQAAPSDAPAAPAFAPANKLTVQPVLTYLTPQRVEERSWRSWGGIMTEQDADGEVQRITRELNKIARDHELALELLPVSKVKTSEDAARAAKVEADVRIVYAAGNSRGTIEKVIAKDRPNIVFLRHRSGPVSLHYEILHPRFLRNNSDRFVDTGVDLDDVVVDALDDLAWRLRALLGLRKTLGTRIVALGGPMGWGEGYKLAPPIARDKWHFDIRTVTYEDLGQRIEKLRKNDAAVADAKKQAGEYLQQPGIELHTKREFIDNAFLLNRVFKKLLDEHDARAFTIGGCMVTVIPIAKTTACLPLTLLNDEGYLAFCESDFVVIPSGILMHHITGQPVFLNDPTWPHHGVVTLAHCTAPRRMNGKTCEPMKLYTHFESDYGAAPKVEMARGQVLTNVIPDFASAKWVAARGKVERSPFYDICRSQIDVTIEGDCDKLVEDMRGFHWMTCYGDCLNEVGYAIKHLGIEFENVSA